MGTVQRLGLIIRPLAVHGLNSKDQAQNEGKGPRLHVSFDTTAPIGWISRSRIESTTTYSLINHAVEATSDFVILSSETRLGFHCRQLPGAAPYRLVISKATRLPAAGCRASVEYRSRSLRSMDYDQPSRAATHHAHTQFLT